MVKPYQMINLWSSGRGGPKVAVGPASPRAPTARYKVTPGQARPAEVWRVAPGITRGWPG